MPQKTIDRLRRLVERPKDFDGGLDARCRRHPARG
jgi:hypothetical protein